MLCHEGSSCGRKAPTFNKQSVMFQLSHSYCTGRYLCIWLILACIESPSDICSHNPSIPSPGFYEAFVYTTNVFLNKISLDSKSFGLAWNRIFSQLKNCQKANAIQYKMNVFVQIFSFTLLYQNSMVKRKERGLSTQQEEENVNIN